MQFAIFVSLDRQIAIGLLPKFYILKLGMLNFTVAHFRLNIQPVINN